MWPSHIARHPSSVCPSCVTLRSQACLGCPRAPDEAEGLTPGHRSARAPEHSNHLVFPASLPLHRGWLITTSAATLLGHRHGQNEPKTFAVTCRRFVPFCLGRHLIYARTACLSLLPSSVKLARPTAPRGPRWAAEYINAAPSRLAPRS